MRILKKFSAKLVAFVEEISEYVNEMKEAERLRRKNNKTHDEFSKIAEPLKNFWK